jgi:hypothetical protein
MNKIFLKFSKLTLAIMAVVSMASCLKSNDATFTDFSQAGNIVTLQNSGLGNVKNSNINLFGGDSTIVNLRVQYNGEFTTPNDLNVTLAVNDAKRVEYLTTNTANAFLAFLPSMYKMGPTNLVIKGGQRFAESSVIIYHNAIKAQPLDKSWMLPISLTNASGAPIASNFETMYINVIGNPLAGTYTVAGTRYNYTGFASYSGPPAAIPTPVSTTAIPVSKTALPIDGQTITMSFSNLGFGTGFEYGYLITGNPGFSSISVGYNSDFNDDNSKVLTYLVSYVSPTPTRKASFRVITHYNNNTTGTGNDRIIDETFTQQ